jgi:hypothetical protein
MAVTKIDGQTLLLKNVSRIRKKTFYLQFCMGTPEGNELAG